MNGEGRRAGESERGSLDRGRLVAWTAFVALFSALAWGSRAADSGASNSQADFFSWSFFGVGLINTAILLLPIVGIAHNRGDLLALRRPRAWGRALGLALLTYLGVSIVSEIVVALGLHPGSQQGLLPSGWEHGHTTPFVANTLYVVTVVPFVEETLMRGIGYGLLRPLGSAPAVVLTAGAWALLHGFPDGIPILFAFGIGLALIRERTGSTIPGMILHGIFNGIAVAVALHPF